jgi:hypothetical protein
MRSTGKGEAIRPPRFFVPAIGALVGIAGLVAGGQAPVQTAVRAVSWTDVAPIVAAMPDAVPGLLTAAAGASPEQRFASWVAEERQAHLRRLARGEEDALVNLLLFGTSFTREPRMTTSRLAELDGQWRAGDRTAQDRLLRSYRRRAADLVAAIGGPAGGERFRLAGEWLRRAGHGVGTAAARERSIEFLLGALARVREEAATLTRQLESLRNLRPDEAAAHRSRVFRDRGLASDSSVLTQFAVDKAIHALSADGVLAAATVRNVAIVGPGLDFLDKQEGVDLYDPQSLQPFTVMDSIEDAGLAAAGAVQVTTLDLNPSVNQHLRRAIARAQNRQPYRLVLPRDLTTEWNSDAIAYWKRAGSRIGLFEPKPAVSTLATVELRALLVRPAAVRRLRILDADIVCDRLPGNGAFDLVVATNVLLYYDRFQQALALASIASMLRPGGILLTNGVVPDLDAISMRAAGGVAVPFSARAGDGEQMLWYRVIRG